MKYLFIILLSCQLVSCANSTELKAPCNYHGDFCGKKIRINQ